MARNFFATVMMLVFLIITPLVVQAQQMIVVDFTTGQLWHLYGEGQRDRYQVVLPKIQVQEQMNLSSPVRGSFTQADYKPTWWPTENMRKRKPSLPTAVSYGQSGHPIGIYRLRIAWQNPQDPEFWAPVRIHGGAKLADLNEAESAGCVRMLDADITRLVENIKRHSGDVQVMFGRM